MATGIDNLGPVRQTPPVEDALTELAGKLRKDNGRIADRIERSAQLPQLMNTPLRLPASHPEARLAAQPISENARQATGVNPHGRSSSVRNSMEEDVLDVPLFLCRKAS